MVIWLLCFKFFGVILLVLSLVGLLFWFLWFCRFEYAFVLFLITGLILDLFVCFTSLWFGLFSFEFWTFVVVALFSWGWQGCLWFEAVLLCLLLCVLIFDLTNFCVCFGVCVAFVGFVLCVLRRIWVCYLIYLCLIVLLWGFLVLMRRVILVCV